MGSFGSGRCCFQVSWFRRVFPLLSCALATLPSSPEVLASLALSDPICVDAVEIGMKGIFTTPESVEEYQVEHIGRSAWENRGVDFACSVLELLGKNRYTCCISYRSDSLPAKLWSDFASDFKLHFLV